MRASARSSYPSFLARDSPDAADPPDAPSGVRMNSTGLPRGVPDDDATAGPGVEADGVAVECELTVLDA